MTSTIERQPKGKPFNVGDLVEGQNIVVIVGVGPKPLQNEFYGSIIHGKEHQLGMNGIWPVSDFKRFTGRVILEQF